MRLYAGVINQRLVTFTEDRSLLADSQAGSRPHLAVQRQIFAVQHLIDKQVPAGQKLIGCFLELTAAYDRVSRPLLWEVLGRLGVHGAMLAAVQAMYSSATVAARDYRRQGPELPSLTGVKQGCPLSPTLSGLLADGLHNFLQAAARADGIFVTADLTVTDLGYADDFCLVSATADGLQRLIDGADAWCAAVGMQASPAKTLVMELTSSELPQGQWTCSGQPLRVVSKARYLGVTFQAGKGCMPTFASLRSKALQAWALLWQQYGRLECGRSMWLMLQLYQACVMPAGQLACEVWGVLPLK